MTPRTLSVIVADDHEAYRNGLVRACDREPRLEIVATAADGVEALNAISALEPDLALLDFQMPGLTGLDVCAAVCHPAPGFRTRCVLLSADMNEELAAEARLAGAVAALHKMSSRKDIVGALLAAA